MHTQDVKLDRPPYSMNQEETDDQTGSRDASTYGEEVRKKPSPVHFNGVKRQCLPRFRYVCMKIRSPLKHKPYIRGLLPGEPKMLADTCIRGQRVPTNEPQEGHNDKRHNHDQHDLENRSLFHFIFFHSNIAPMTRSLVGVLGVSVPLAWLKILPRIFDLTIQKVSGPILPHSWYVCKAWPLYRDLPGPFIPKHKANPTNPECT